MSIGGILHIVLLQPASSPARRFRSALALRRQRSQLSELGDHTLKDIGITREQAEFEASRPVWDVPSHWRA